MAVGLSPPHGRGKKRARSPTPPPNTSELDALELDGEPETGPAATNSGATVIKIDYPPLTCPDDILPSVKKSLYQFSPHTGHTITNFPRLTASELQTTTLHKAHAIAQLRHYDLPSSRRDRVDVIVASLHKFVAAGKCDSVPAKVQKIHKDLEKKYLSENAKHLEKLSAERLRAWEQAGMMERLRMSPKYFCEVFAAGDEAGFVLRGWEEEGVAWGTFKQQAHEMGLYTCVRDGVCVVARNEVTADAVYRFALKTWAGEEAPRNVPKAPVLSAEQLAAAELLRKRKAHMRWLVSGPPEPLPRFERTKLKETVEGKWWVMFERVVELEAMAARKEGRAEQRLLMEVVWRWDRKWGAWVGEFEFGLFEGVMVLGREMNPEDGFQESFSGMWGGDKSDKDEDGSPDDGEDYTDESTDEEMLDEEFDDEDLASHVAPSMEAYLQNLEEIRRAREAHYSDEDDLYSLPPQHRPAMSPQRQGGKHSDDDDDPFGIGPMATTFNNTHVPIKQYTDSPDSNSSHLQETTNAPEEESPSDDDDLYSLPPQHQRTMPMQLDGGDDPEDDDDPFGIGPIAATQNYSATTSTQYASFRESNGSHLTSPAEPSPFRPLFLPHDISGSSSNDGAHDAAMEPEHGASALSDPSNDMQSSEYGSPSPDSPPCIPPHPPGSFTFPDRSPMHEPPPFGHLTIPFFWRGRFKTTGRIIRNPNEQNQGLLTFDPHFRQFNGVMVGTCALEPDDPDSDDQYGYSFTGRKIADLDPGEEEKSVVDEVSKPRVLGFVGDPVAPLERGWSRRKRWCDYDPALEMKERDRAEFLHMLERQVMGIGLRSGDHILRPGAGKGGERL